MKKFILTPLFLFLVQLLSAQQYEWNAGRILLEIQKLNNTGSVLYIAAHPDDENTRLIAYMANELKVRTGYLSLTRGDGGQNLIGEEQGAYLGLIRTQELLAARKVDGGEQFFTRAIDFGYSKSADETFTKWPHDSLLADVVWVIRNFRPDVIITRFPADERAGHGQHTVSAMLAEEAFTAAADPTRFPEQLQYVSVWQAQRLFWNNSTWWDKDLPAKIASGDSSLAAFDTGGYNPLLGKSYGEIAGESRTNHKSQGFGTAPVRGQQMEYLEQKSGTAFTDNNILSGINISWERYRQGSDIKMLLDKIISTYDAVHPEKSVDDLLKAYDMIDHLPSDKLLEFKKMQLQNIVAAALGIWLEPVAEKEMTGVGDTIRVISTCLKRNEYPLTLESVEINDEILKVGEILPAGINQTDTLSVVIPQQATSSPYWLNDRDVYSTAGLFSIPDQLMRGKAYNDPALSVIYHCMIGKTELNFKRGIVYKETDAVKGEIVTPLTVLPEVTATLSEHLVIMADNQPKTVSITVHSNVDHYHGSLMIYQNEVNAKRFEFTLDSIGDFETFSYSIEPPANEGIITITPTLMKFLGADGSLIQGPIKEVKTIAYDHIQTQHIFENASIRLVKMNTVVPDKKIGYIEGAGDKVDESLQQLGCNVVTIDPQNITAAELKKYDVVIIGVRAYNVSKAMTAAQPIIMDYVKNGGHVITQYSTNWDNYVKQIGPFPFAISRGRVTDENSPVDFLLPDQRVLNVPNKITQDDFKDWVQERGIYFATDPSSEYLSPLAFTDPKEKAQNGSLIIAPYGAGTFMYTGIVFFRELPAGVIGAYKLFVNMIMYQ